MAVALTEELQLVRQDCARFGATVTGNIAPLIVFLGIWDCSSTGKVGAWKMNRCDIIPIVHQEKIKYEIRKMYLFFMCCL